MNRAYSLIEVKSLDEKRRTFSGWATTPEVDRVGDTIDPLGASFKNPLVLLHQHDKDRPIGNVTFKKPTAKGIEFTAELPVIDEPGLLKDRIDLAWGEIKAGLVRAVSIGFRAVKYAFRDDGGIDFKQIEIYELSTVSVPANGSALITSVKSIDKELRRAAGVPEPEPTPNPNAPKPQAASGQKQFAVVRLTPPGVTGTKQPTKTPQEGQTVKISEKIARFEEKRAANMARITAIHEETDESLNESQLDEIKGLESEVETIDRDLPSLKRAETSLAKSAKPVPRPVSDDGAVSFQTLSVKAVPEPPKGIRFARYARCVGLAGKLNRDIMSVAKELYGERDPNVVEMVKAAGTAVGALNTTTDSALIGNVGGFADFVEFLRAMTIVGRFGTNGYPSLRRIPFRVPIITQPTGSSAYWVGEGDGKPLTKPTFGRTTLAPLKVATIAVATMELLRDSSPAAETLIRDDLAAAVAERIDISFIGSTGAGDVSVSGVSPASITYGAETIAATGTGDADDIRLDFRSAMQKFIDSKNPLNTGVVVMSTANALALSMLLNPLGQPEFPNITMSGGTFMGLPVMTSEYVSDFIVIMNASDVWFADDGGVQIDMSTEASLQMVGGNDEGSTQNSISPTATSVVSLWQTNSVGFRAERTLDWALRRSTAVVVITGAEWGGAVVPS
jgi:HK97 family phage major capsid protein/HK97 family phage prohead protease